MTRNRFAAAPAILIALVFATLAGAPRARADGKSAAPAGKEWAKTFRLPVPERETLPNGLEIAWFVSDRLPLVDLAVLVKSGTRDDAPGKSGTAEMVAATLDRGAAGKGAEEIARSVESLGASRYVNASDDTFSIGMHGLAEDAETLLGILSDLVTRPDFPQAEFDKERSRMLARWEHIGDYGQTLASLAFHRILSSGTSYARGSLVSVEEFKKVTRSDVAAYHSRHFTPRNSVLMVVGNVDRGRFRQAILRSLGGWSGEAPKREWKDYSNPRLVPAKGEVVLVNRPGLSQAQVRMGFRGPLIDSPEHYALVVANTLLGEFFYSRLNARIRDELGLTYGIGSSFSYSKDFAFFSIGTSTRNEMTGALVRKTEEIVKDLKKGPLAYEEVSMAKDYLLGGFPLDMSTISSIASRWLAGVIFGLGDGYLNEFMPKVSAVTPEEVKAAVVKHFKPEEMLIVIAGDAAAIEPHLRAAGYTAIKRVEVKDLK